MNRTREKSGSMDECLKRRSKGAKLITKTKQKKKKKKTTKKIKRERGRDTDKWRLL